MDDSITRQYLGVKVNELAGICQFIEQSASQIGVPADDVTDLVVAVHEVVTNILVHGYEGRAGDITIDLVRKGHDLQIRLRDWAPPFDPTQVPAPDITRPLEERPYGGLGVHMIRNLVDEWSYGTTNEGQNELVLVKLNVV